MTKRAYVLLLLGALVQDSPAAGAQGSALLCNQIEPGSMESLICQDQRLSALDRQLAAVYTVALAKARHEHPSVLKAEQRGWIKGRDDCWKSADKRQCVHEEYLRRIAELQAKYRLVSSTGPVVFVCDGQPANEVQATYFKTNPLTLIAERGDETSLMFQQQIGSEIKYRGRNETLSELAAGTRITWGYGTREMQCKKKP